MRGRKSGSMIVEVIICSVLAAAVILGGLDLSIAALRISKTSLAQRGRAASLSALMGEITACLVSADVKQKYGWSVSLDILEPGPGSFASPTAVTVAGKIKAVSLDMRWKEWNIRGRK
ncbi:MAG: hypothetical protein LBS45_04935 [Synergistaceae bacterium]|nr:hypothetical protein [Synergistaceae bacterium]